MLHSKITCIAVQDASRSNAMINNLAVSRTMPKQEPSVVNASLHRRHRVRTWSCQGSVANVKKLLRCCCRGSAYTKVHGQSG